MPELADTNTPVSSVPVGTTENRDAVGQPSTAPGFVMTSPLSIPEFTQRLLDHMHEAKKIALREIEE